MSSRRKGEKVEIFRKEFLSFKTSTKKSNNKRKKELKTAELKIAIIDAETRQLRSSRRNLTPGELINFKNI